MDYFNYTNQSDSGNYGNEPRQYTPGKNYFALASCLCGIIAFATLCTGIFPMIAGSLSIIFAVMSHRKGKQMETTALTGIAFSSIALLFVAFILLYSYIVLPKLLENDQFRNQMRFFYENMYGSDFDTFIEPYYNPD